MADADPLVKALLIPLSAVPKPVDGLWGQTQQLRRLVGFEQHPRGEQAVAPGPQGAGRRGLAGFDLSAAEADVVIMVHPDYQYTPRLIPAMASLALVAAVLWGGIAWEAHEFRDFRREMRTRAHLGSAHPER